MACIDAAYVGPPAMAIGVTRASVYFVSHGTALHTMDPKDAARMALQSEARALRPLVRAGERVVAIFHIARVMRDLVGEEDMGARQCQAVVPFLHFLRPPMQWSPMRARGNT
jgi:hypothetical protein